ncbi:MAG: AAA family ATPase [Desulfitobacteriaceae bacterium]
MNNIIIKTFGPVDYFKATIGKKLTILIGQQATGKSTIVKLIYFCESTRDELVKFLFNEKLITENSTKQLLFEFSSNMTNRFNHFFGNTKHNEFFEIKFSFGETLGLTISKKANGNLEIKFNDQLKNVIHDFMVSYKKYYSSLESTNIDASNLFDITFDISRQEFFFKKITNEVNKVLGTNYSNLYIPAGRYWATMVADVELEIIPDALMQNFAKYIKVLRRSFIEKMETMIESKKVSIKNSSKYKKNAENAMLIIRQILKGDYIYSLDREKLYFKDDKFIDISQASSGQQEILWILLILFDIILNNKKMFLVIEEPEAHIFPETQKQIMELIALAINVTDSQILITTHSPYILTSTNLLIHAANVENKIKDEETVIKKDMRLDKEKVGAYMLTNNGCFAYREIIDVDTGLIEAREIDSVSDIINQVTDKLLDLEVKHGL